MVLGPVDSGAEQARAGLRGFHADLDRSARSDGEAICVHFPRVMLDKFCSDMFRINVLKNSQKSAPCNMGVPYGRLTQSAGFAELG